MQRLFSTKNLLLILILLLCFGGYYNYINFTVPSRVPTSPDLNDALFFSRQLAEEGTFVWHSDFNDKYHVPVFRPRLLKPLGNNNFTSRKAIGFIALLALARMLGIIAIFPSIMAVLGLVAVYLLVREVFDEKVAVIALLLTAVMPVWMHMANTYADSLPATVFYIFSLYFFFKALNRPEKQGLFLFWAGLFFAVVVAVRVDYVVLSIPFIVLGLFFLSNRRLYFKEVIVGLGGFFLLVVSVLLASKIFFGSAVTTGHAVKKEVLVPSVGGSFYYWPTFRIHVFQFVPLLVVLGFLGLFVCARKKRTRYFGLLTFVAALDLFLFHGWRAGTTAYGQPSPLASVARYMLPMYVFLAIWAAVSIRAAAKAWRFSFFSTIVAPSLVVLLTVLPAFGLGAGTKRTFAYYRGPAKRAWEINKVVRESPTNSVFFTKVFDKAIFLDRQVAIYHTEEDVKKREVASYWYEPMRPLSVESDLVPLVERLKRDGINVYLVQDAEDLMVALRKEGARLALKSTRPAVIYEVMK